MLTEEMLEEILHEKRVGKLEVRQVGERFIATYYKSKLAAIGNTELEALTYVRDATDLLLAEMQEK